MTAYIKIRMTRGGSYRGKLYAVGESLEIKVGNKASFTWEQLEQAYAALQGRADRGEVLEEQESPTFAVYAEKWLAIAESRLSPDGYRNTKSLIRNQLIPYFGDTGLQFISPSDIDLWQSKQLATVCPATVVRQRNTLSAILSTAQRDGFLPLNPCIKSVRVRVPEQDIHYLTREEIDKVLSAAGSIREWLGDYILWCLLSGMRQCEVRNLRWGNIISSPTGNQYVQFKTGKTYKQRTVACSPEMVQIILRQKNRKLEDDDRVFPVAKITVVRAWEALRQATGLTGITLQSLRATCATFGVSGGVPSRIIGGMLGHSGGDAMLVQHYAGRIESAEMQAAITIQNMILGTGSCQSQP